MPTPPYSWAPIEQRLWRAMRDGHSLNLAAGPPDCGADFADGEVAADVVASLLLQPPSPALGVVTRLQLTAAHITGRLSLRHAMTEAPTSLINCCFDEPIELDNAALRAADFTGCHPPAFQADGLWVDSDLALVRLVTGKVSRRWWSTAGGQAIGYHARDDPESSTTVGEPVLAKPEDQLVGGTMATRPLGAA